VRIVGGAYRENCLVPPRNDLAGSGVRAAAVLRAVDPDIVLTTAIEPGAVEEFEAVIEAVGVRAEVARRDEAVGFSYFTPLSAPAINGVRSRHEPISIVDKAALVFGLVEGGELTVETSSLVLDPQQPRDLIGLDLSRLRFDRLAIVANRAETLALGDATGETDEERLTSAARQLIDRYGAEVVVTKRAAQGALVTTADDVKRIGVFPTTRVYPIGSGDVFAAGFAWAWTTAEHDPSESARIGSRLASLWCEHRSLSIPADYFAVPPAEDELAPTPVRIYLAAPFFSLGELWMVELVRDTLVSLGASVFSPWHDVGPGGDEVARADLEGLESCDGILALLDGNDPGTVFEVGWGRAHGLPVVAFTQHADAEGAKMLRGTDAEVHSDLTTAVYRSIWAAIMASRD
jgi:nucleoside 2-deoxyribosyltransferase